MKIKFENALIIKNFDDEPFVGDLLVEDDKIVYVGGKTDLQADRVIDATGKIIMPGFVDAHTHSAMTLFKGRAGDKKLDDWLFDMFCAEKKLTGNDVYYGTSLACLEYAKNGITTVNDNYHFADYSAKAFVDCGIRAVVSVTQKYNMKKFLSQAELEALYGKITSQSPLITANFYNHSVYNSGEDMFAVANKLAKKHKTFVSTHASETLEEVGKCASQNNDLSPIELLEEYGFFDQKALAIHCTNVSEHDIQILARYGASVCANFGSNFKLASGIAPIVQMKKYGINVCLGTDGSASNNRLDMFREMFLAGTSQNILLSQTGLISAKEILKMATVNGAKALGLNNVGTLQNGNFADLIMLDGNKIDGAINNDLFENLVYSFGTEDIVLTMCNGKILYDKGKFFFKKSQNQIIKKAKEIAKKL
ncbi:MAG: amidohydrolase family protein [Christensenellales bacterium]